MTNNHQPTPGDVESSGGMSHDHSLSSISPAEVDLAPLWDLIKRLPTYVRLSAALARDSRVPRLARASLALGGIYVVSPVDLIPGLIPVAGQLDDLYVALTGLQQAMRLTPSTVAHDHLAAVGLTSATIDDDLATLRTFVREGVAWALQRGGKAMASASRQTRALIHHARSMGSNLR